MEAYIDPDFFDRFTELHNEVLNTIVIRFNELHTPSFETKSAQITLKTWGEISAEDKDGRVRFDFVGLHHLRKQIQGATPSRDGYEGFLAGQVNIVGATQSRRVSWIRFRFDGKNLSGYRGGPIDMTHPARRWKTEEEFLLEQDNYPFLLGAYAWLDTLKREVLDATKQSV